MYGIRIIMGMIRDNEFAAIQGNGQIIRDKAWLYKNSNILEDSESFSAWRVLQIQRGDQWIDYDGFDMDKVINNEDNEGNNYKEDCDGDCDNCDEEDCDGYEEDDEWTQQFDSIQAFKS